MRVEEADVKAEGRSSAGRLVIATIAGAVAGAVAGLLLAPRSGSETRRQIGGYVDTARETVSRVPAALKSASHAAKETLVGRPEDGKPSKPAARS